MVNIVYDPAHFLLWKLLIAKLHNVVFHKKTSLMIFLASLPGPRQL